MMQVEEVKQVWLVGIGGIGMSALARYFHREGKPVAGYDRRPSGVTEALESEGISVFFDSSPDCIAPVFRAPRHTLVIYTPAVEQEQERSEERRVGKECRWGRGTCPSAASVR